MALHIDRTGDFRGAIVDYGLKEESSGSVAIVIEAKVESQWNEETKQWDSWQQYDEHRATGYVYIIKKDGSLNENQVKALCQFAGWDGDLASIAKNTWTPTPCQFKVETDEYQGQTRYRISWLNEYDRTPGGMGQVSDEKLKLLNQRFAGPLKAIASVAKKAPAVPNGKPKPPAPARELVTAENTPKDEVPF